jgi:hypothetical protein
MPTYRYRTASVQAFNDQSISIARVCGIVTPATLGLIISDSGRWAREGDDLAHLVDYSGATFALDLGAMLGAAQSAKPANAMQAPPAAFVVSADQMPAFDGYAAAMQRRGYLLAAFTAAAEARRWAARQAQVRAHWLGLRAALRLSAPGSTGKAIGAG